MWGEVDVIAALAFGKLAMTGEEIVSQGHSGHQSLVFGIQLKYKYKYKNKEKECGNK